MRRANFSTRSFMRDVHNSPGDPVSFTDGSGTQRLPADTPSPFIPSQWIAWSMVDVCNPDAEGPNCTIEFVPIAGMPLAAVNGLTLKLMAAIGTTARMGSKLEATIENLSGDCLKALGDLGNQFGVPLSQMNLEAGVLNLSFFSAAGPEGSLYLTYAGMPGNFNINGNPSGLTTIAQYMQSMPLAGAVVVDGGNGLLMPDVILRGLDASGMTLLHEELHCLLQADDPQIAQALSGMGVQLGGGSASEQWDQWLRSNCGK